MSKVILITGTSTGIGLETALQLAEQGHQVYATMRDLNKRSLLDQEAERRKVKLWVLQLNVQDEKSIAACISEIFSAEQSIDVLNQIHLTW